MQRMWIFGLVVLFSSMAVPCVYGEQESPPKDFPLIETKPDTGYRGIWYANQPTGDIYRFKYSGGLGTYPAKHIPVAYYSKEANKTFFVYGGSDAQEYRDGHKPSLWIMVSYYDHATGKVPRPRMLMDKKTADAHDNPVIMLDGKGHVWVFVAAHGTARPSYMYRSVEPYAIDRFHLIQETNFSYPQPWYIDGKGFLFLHTRYEGGRRNLYFITSPDGMDWSEPTLLASMQRGHYQISWRHRNKVGTAFNFHPDKGGLNARTNLYYVETKDFGESWQAADGTKIELPMRDTDSPAIVRDYENRRLVYLKDLTFTEQGKPVVLYLMSHDYRPGPDYGRRIWTLARHYGRQWMVTGGSLASDHNYDMGSLYLLGGARMEIIAPIVNSPQAYGTGGEMALLWTQDGGKSWHSSLLTRESPLNHTYARRPVNAHPHFRAFWADGHARQVSVSRLYFCDADGRTYRLPRIMQEDQQEPEVVPIGEDRELTLEELWLDPEDVEGLDVDLPKSQEQQ